jgi:predicted alpha/beta superfamily hydrolase
MSLIKEIEISQDAIDYQTWVFDSEILHRDFKLFISNMVDNQAVDSENPVVYLLDANFMFPIIQGVIRLLQSTGELPSLILVGIGYKSSAIGNMANRRIQELTPTKDIHYKDIWRDITKVNAEGGEAPLLLKVIEEEIKPFIQRQYSSSGQSILVGDSLGGLFALYALFSKPNLFRGYVIGSPAIFWDNGILWQQEKKYYSLNNKLSADVFLGVGELEDTHPYHFPKSTRHLASGISLVKDVQAMSQRLQERKYEQLNMKTHIFEGETHMSVIAPLISRGLRFVLAKYSG